MLSKSARRPTPALIVAIIALVAALAGTAVALPGKNTVSSNDIKKNAVRSSDIKNDKVKGVDVKESSLGQVPSALRADSAATVDTQRHIGPVRLALGQSQVLDTRGPFTVTARCVDGGGDQIDAEIILTTSQDGAFGYSEWSGTEETDLNAGDEVVIGGDQSNNATDPSFYSGYSAWTFASADGNTVYAGERAYAGARIGGADCYFGIMPVF
jgi:hypothetical protein